MPSYPSFFALAQYSSNVPVNPQLVARTLSLKFELVSIAEIGEANEFNDESSNAVDADEVEFRNFLRFKFKILKILNHLINYLFFY